MMKERIGVLRSLIWLGPALAFAACGDELNTATPTGDASVSRGAAPAAEARHAALACTWSQWGRAADHNGAACAVGQAPTTISDHLIYDPFEQQEIAEAGGVLGVHYQVPLNDAAGNFYMLQKGGTYTACDPPGSGSPAPCGLDQGNIVQETWSENKYRRDASGAAALEWSFTSDWKPFPIFFFEPMFQPALFGPLLYVPGAGGSVWQVFTPLHRPIVLQRINPFPTVDAETYVTSGITVDRLGFLYWTAVQRDPTTRESRGFLIKAAPWGQTWKVDYEFLIPGAPAATDLCFTTFNQAVPRPPRPFPPSADAVPPQAPCGRQRPGVNATPAIGPDGTIYVASHADRNDAYSYLIALRPDLSLKWATSLRGLVLDGCGVTRVDSPEGNVRCSRTFSAIGVDPNTNQPPALQVDDASSSSPVALPDGGVVYGALDNYNFSRGHLVKLDAAGQLAGTYPFGWDTTPAIYQHDATYSIILKDNHYNTGGPFFVTQLSRDLQVEWKFQNAQTDTCVRQPDGTLACSELDAEGFEHPGGFEWCVNAPAVDAQGNVFANAEDGFVYQIGQGGIQKTQTFLNGALGAAYTPISLDAQGRIYALNNGELTVFGQ